jgi:hypothetical protein
MVKGEIGVVSFLWSAVVNSFYFSLAVAIVI